MIGAIAGDMIGSRFEFNNILGEDFGMLFDDECAYTDDSILTVATAEVILDEGKYSYSTAYLEYAQSYPGRGWGGNFNAMVQTGNLQPYNSYGNGSAMRIAPVGWAYDTLEETVANAKKSAECTHNHEEGIKGAVSMAGAIWMARQGNTKEEIKQWVESQGYDLSKKTEDFKQGKFDVTCQGTIPRCMAIILETDDYESAMRKAVAMGGDVDTNCCIVGSICDALYGLPSRDIIEDVYKRLPKEMTDVTTLFVKKYIDENFEEPKEIATKTNTMENYFSTLFGS